MTLPLYYIPMIPPSLNKSRNCFVRRTPEGKNYVQVLPSAEFNHFKKHVIPYLQGVTPIKGLVNLYVYFVPKDRRKRDNDNILKAFQDSLTECGIIEDDSFIVTVEITRLLHNKNKHGIYFIIEPMSEIKSVDDLLKVFEHSSLGSCQEHSSITLEKPSDEL